MYHQTYGSCNIHTLQPWNKTYLIRKNITDVYSEGNILETKAN